MRKASPIRIMALSLFLVAAVATAPGGLLGSAGAESGDGALAYTTVPVGRGGFSPGVSPGGVFADASKNVNITRKPDAQSETSIAVDPTNPRHMLAASNDLGDTTHIYESFDGGRRWREAGLNLGSTFCYDPWLDFNAAGDAFFAYECFDQRVAYKKKGQTTWTKAILNNAGGFPDRDMIIVDTTPASPLFNSVYIGYDDANNNNAAHVLYSRDGFGNWLRSPKINNSSSTIGVNAAVGLGGEVYATWLDFSGKKLVSDRSFDGGATFGADSTVHNFRLPTQNFFISIPPQPDRGIVPMPFSDTAPAGTSFAGRLYVTYTDKGVTTADTNIYVRFSDNDGVTWSPEVMVNDDSVNAYQFHPSISVSRDGTVGVSFYDTRDDPNDEKTHQYTAFSTNGGVTWSANLRVTTEQSDESGSGDPNDYGDYQGLDASPNRSFAQVWTDSRPSATAEDMFAARVQP
jgi:hypothetical protein